MMKRYYIDDLVSEQNGKVLRLPDRPGCKDTESSNNSNTDKNTAEDDEYIVIGRYGQKMLKPPSRMYSKYYGWY